MKVSEEKKDQVLILELKGKLDVGTSKDLEDILTGWIDRGETRLVLDGAELSYVSSSGLRVLLVAAKKLAAPAGKIVLCSLNERIKRIFDMTGFAGLFEVYDSRDAAVDRLRN